MPLASLGAVLLGARLLDAVADPLIGRWADACSRARRASAWLAAAACGAWCWRSAFAALFFPPVRGTAALLAWCAALLAVTYLGYSVVTRDPPGLGRAAGRRRGAARAHRRLARRPGAGRRAGGQRAAVGGRAGREHAGVRRAAAGRRGAGCGARRGRQRRAPPRAAPRRCACRWPRAAFRRLLAIYLRQRHRQRGAGHAGAVLHPRPAAGAGATSRCSWPATSPPARCRCRCGCARCARFGLARSWLAGMVLAIAVFAWAALLGAGDVAAFAAVCVASGVALGADLTLPGALLAGVIQRAGHARPRRRRLLRLVELRHQAQPRAGRRPGAAAAAVRSATRRAAATTQALAALTLAYCLLPCVLKLARGGAALPDLDPTCRTDSHEQTLSCSPPLAAGALALGCARRPTPADYAAEKPVLDLRAATSTASSPRTASSPTAPARWCAASPC